MYNLSCSPLPTADERIEIAEEAKRIEIKKKYEWKNGDLLFKVARLIAESDSIGEGCSYFPDYFLANHKNGNEYKDLAKKIIKLCKQKETKK